MQTQVGLGFVWLLLNENQKAEVKRAWSKFPRGRHLMPFEIGRILKMELKKTVEDPQADSMMRTWIDFLPFERDEWWAWMDYAVKNYCEPLPVAGRTDWGNA